MKLTNSVLPLLNTLDATVFAQKGFQDSVKALYADLKANDLVKDALKAVRWNIWYALSHDQRQAIISHSNLPCIGGYYDYDDANLDALLRKALPLTKLIKMVA